LQALEETNPITPEFLEWLTWAKTRTENHDPFLKQPDEWSKKEK